MLFNSYIFLFLFLPLCLGGYYLLAHFGKAKPAKLCLTGFSLWFYGYFNPSYLFIMLFSILFPILFLLFIGMFFFALISNLRTWNKNNHSPRLTVPATVVAKRTDVSHSSSANAGDMSGAHGYDTSTFTSYYVTFQVESGDRMEFEVDGSDYGLLVQGDIGKLSFQGTRYLGFERS